MRSLHIRCATLCLPMLATLLVMPAPAAVRSCAESPSATAALDPACAARSRAAIERPAAHFANRAALKRAALVQPEPVLTRPLTEAEARQALDLELSLKVGKHMREADYPDEAQRWRWSGTALVEVLLNAEGLVQKVVLSRSSGFRILDRQAIEVVRRVPRLYVPVQLRGRPQRAIVPVTFHFKSV
jgi:TonB family protein